MTDVGNFVLQAIDIGFEGTTYIDVIGNPRTCHKPSGTGQLCLLLFALSFTLTTSGGPSHIVSMLESRCKFMLVFTSSKSYI
jgi:hypothetical protein